VYRQKKCGLTKEEIERTVLEESWKRNGPVGPSLEVIDDDDDVANITYTVYYQTPNHCVLVYTYVRLISIFNVEVKEL
jgi:hypothetical protein